MYRKPKKYIMLADSKVNTDVKEGTVVYEYLKHDYGLASDDTWITGIEHVSVTLNEDGNYPSFTVPVTDLGEAIE